MKKIFLLPAFLAFIIFLFACERNLDDEAPEINSPFSLKSEPQPGSLDYLNLTSLLSHLSGDVRNEAPGALMIDSMQFGQTYLVFGLLPDNLGMPINLSMQYYFHDDTLKRIIFRGDTCSLDSALAYQLGILAEETIVIDSVRHFIAFENRTKNRVVEFQSCDSLWNYIFQNHITNDSIEVMASIWRDDMHCLTVAFDGRAEQTTGQIASFDSAKHLSWPFGLMLGDIDIFSEY